MTFFYFFPSIYFLTHNLLLCAICIQHQQGQQQQFIAEAAGLWLAERTLCLLFFFIPQTNKAN